MSLPAEDGGSSPPNPPTFRPEDVPALLPLDTSANPRGDSKTVQKSIASTLEDNYYQWVRSQPYPVREGKSGPEVFKSGGGSSNGLQSIDSGDSSSGSWVPLGPQDRGWQIWSMWKQEDADLSAGDYGGGALGGGGGAGGSGAGAARSYLDTETDKQDEVTRQFKDFLTRAKGVYDLMDSEQQYGMNADDQNAQNALAFQRGLLPGAGFYTKPTMSEAYSPTLARSMPNYVSPDYRTNDAVGLGGGEGFNNPAYDSYGMPLYAQGTETAGIPPDLLQMVGKEVWVPVKEPPPGFSWPWGSGRE